MKYEPHAHNKTADPYNIDYVIGTDVSSDNVFRGNVMFDLRIRYYSSAELRLLSTDIQVSMLRKCLITGVEVRRCRDAGLLYGEAIKDRLLDPAICGPCDLHACNRMAGKVLFMVGLAVVIMAIQDIGRYYQVQNQIAVEHENIPRQQ